MVGRDSVIKAQILNVVDIECRYNTSGKETIRNNTVAKNQRIFILTCPCVLKRLSIAAS